MIAVQGLKGGCGEALIKLYELSCKGGLQLQLKVL